MKINNEQTLGSVNNFANSPVANNEAMTVAGNNGSSQSADRVELSIKSSDLDNLKNAMQAVPDIGSEKVAQLKAQISAGTYQVSGNEVAEKMLQNWSELNGN